MTCLLGLHDVGCSSAFRVRLNNTQLESVYWWRAFQRQQVSPELSNTHICLCFGLSQSTSYCEYENLWTALCEEVWVWKQCGCVDVGMISIPGNMTLPARPHAWLLPACNAPLTEWSLRFCSGSERACECCCCFPRCWRLKSRSAVNRGWLHSLFWTLIILLLPRLPVNFVLLALYKNRLKFNL